MDMVILYQFQGEGMMRMIDTCWDKLIKLDGGQCKIMSDSIELITTDRHILKVDIIKPFEKGDNRITYMGNMDSIDGPNFMLDTFKDNLHRLVLRSFYAGSFIIGLHVPGYDFSTLNKPTSKIIILPNEDYFILEFALEPSDKDDLIKNVFSQVKEFFLNELPERVLIDVSKSNHNFSMDLQNWLKTNFYPEIIEIFQRMAIYSDIDNKYDISRMAFGWAMMDFSVSYAQSNDVALKVANNYFKNKEKAITWLKSNERWK